MEYPTMTIYTVERVPLPLPQIFDRLPVQSFNMNKGQENNEKVVDEEEGEEVVSMFQGL